MASLLCYNVVLDVIERVIETEERPNDNLVQKLRAMMSSHVTQMLAIIDIFIKTASNENVKTMWQCDIMREVTRSDIPRENYLNLQFQPA